MLNINKQTKYLTKTAIMIALIYLATFTLKIPSPNGYTHLGDSMIFLSVLILGTKRGALAGGIGAALADLLGGYPQWVIPTFFIKAIMALIMGTVAEKFFTKFNFGWIIGAALGGIFQIIGYTLVKIPMYGLALALGELISVTMQTVTGILISYAVITVLSTAGVIKKLREV